MPSGPSMGPPPAPDPACGPAGLPRGMGRGRAPPRSGAQVLCSLPPPRTGAPGGWTGHAAPLSDAPGGLPQGPSPPQIRGHSSVSPTAPVREIEPGDAPDRAPGHTAGVVGGGGGGALGRRQWSAARSLWGPARRRSGGLSARALPVWSGSHGPGPGRGCAGRRGLRRAAAAGAGESTDRWIQRLLHSDGLWRAAAQPLPLCLRSGLSAGIFPSHPCDRTVPEVL